MSGQNHGAVAFETNDIPPKKRRVMVKTVQKWVVESDREIDMFVWLKYDKVDCEYMATLKCCVSAEFNEKLRGMRNYNPALAVGSKNLRVSSYKDHIVTNMHKRALLLLKKQSSTDVTIRTYC